MKEKHLRMLLALIPGTAVLALIAVAVYTGYGARNILFTARGAVITSYVVMAAFLPLGLYEYARFRYYRRMEHDAARFLSTLEASIIAGLPFFEAFYRAGEYISSFRRVVSDVYKRLIMGERFRDVVDREVPRGTTPLKLLWEYLVLLSEVGEELFASISEYSLFFSKISEFRRALETAARQALVLMALMLFSFSIMLVLVVHVFLYEMATAGWEIIKISPEVMNAIEVAFIYIIVVQSVLGGFTVSRIGGERAYYLPHMLAMGFASLTPFALVIYDVVNLAGFVSSL